LFSVMRGQEVSHKFPCFYNKKHSTTHELMYLSVCINIDVARQVEGECESSRWLDWLECIVSARKHLQVDDGSSLVEGN
jgi:hypothetical protein